MYGLFHSQRAAQHRPLAQTTLARHLHVTDPLHASQPPLRRGRSHRVCRLGNGMGPRRASHLRRPPSISTSSSETKHPASVHNIPSPILIAHTHSRTSNRLTTPLPPSFHTPSNPRREMGQSGPGILQRPTARLLRLRHLRRRRLGHVPARAPGPLLPTLPLLHRPLATTAPKRLPAKLLFPAHQARTHRARPLDLVLRRPTALSVRQRHRRRR